ncbi:MAG: hypothetical protein KKH98_03985, partial [Spirochaetes bacterium]|nr:hypothetical protein [Spirochaetota bacterium]
MNLVKESLEVSENALVICSQIPIGINLKRDLENSSVWVPKIVVVTPKDETFIVKSNSIYKKGVPTYIIYKGENGKEGASIWYSDRNIEKDLVSRLRGYVLVPGDFEDHGSVKKIYTFKDSFIPDKKDKNQKKLDIHLISGYDTLDYSERDNFSMHVRKKDLPFTFYILLDSVMTSHFGYDCSHS